MTKLVTQETVFRLYDDDKNSNLLEVTILVIDSWINRFAAHDTLILNNTLKLLEVMVKSRTFYNRFKDRMCLNTLTQIGREPSTAPGTKSLILRINSCLQPTFTWNTHKFFQTPDYTLTKLGMRKSALAQSTKDLFGAPMYEQN
jgi:hypothetical protein